MHDTAIGNLIATTLETQNYQFRRARNGAQAVMDALSYRPDVMLLDLGLPDMDGIDIIKKILSWSNMPIIVVSARSDDRDKVAALDAGADDYLTKPFSVDELLARLRVALRRVRYDSQKTSEEAARYQNGGLFIDYAAELPSLRVFMATLRKKLEADPGHPEYIQTHIGVGYRMIQHNRDSAVSPEA